MLVSGGETRLICESAWEGNLAESMGTHEALKDGELV